MKTVIVKVFNKKGMIKEVVATTKSGELTVLQAQPGVNYELLDESTNKAPDHIVTKRVDDNLLVSFEREGEKAELLIEDFYQYGGRQALIGLSEKGGYHHYIPDTGEVSDHVVHLKAGEIEGQALGKESLDSPLWVSNHAWDSVSLPDWGGMGNTPKWVAVGILGLGGLAAVSAVRYVRDKDDDDIVGDNKNNVIDTGKGNDFIDGRGGSDKIDAGRDNDTIIYDQADSKIDGGAGFDTLKFVDTGTINLNNAIKNIEVFDLRNSKSQALKIGAADVLSVTDSDNQLFIDGDSSDKIEISGLTANNAKSLYEPGYNLYSAKIGGDEVMLYIDEQITNII
ncbi:MAG: hypothetical protein CR975_00310 [Gammaproteobacteria bacterium]|nr:MAG: hypothetical protein CR975_00310 [Gammaproteobacteria bacterium]